jgi:hypothetical protein
MPPVSSTEEGAPPDTADIDSWQDADTFGLLMDAGLEKAAADQLSGAGWGDLQVSSALAVSLQMPFSAACSLQRQMLTLTVIKTSWKLVTLERQLLKAVRRDGVLRASATFALPPLKVFGFFLEHGHGRSAEATRDALNQPEAYLSGETLNMFHVARHADGVTQTADQDRNTAEYAAAFEREVEARLVAAGVPFLTEDAQKRARPPGTPSVATPDFLIPSDFALVVGVDRDEVRWIEVKNFFGSALGYHGKKIRSQFEKYRRLYGPGAVVFKCVAGESVLSVLPPDVIVLKFFEA